MLHRGKITKVPEVLELRALTREDLSLLANARPGDGTRAGASPVQKLRDTHHRLARMVASGLRMDALVAQSGYSYARIATLQKDPAFIELVAKYRERVDDAWAEAQDAYVELLTSNMVKAERMLADKLDEADEKDEKLPTRELIAISRDAADRMGYGKRQTNLNVNVDFAAKLEAARARSRPTRQIEGSLAPQSPQLPALPGANGLRRI